MPTKLLPPNSPKPKPRKAAPKVKAARIYTHVYEVVVENTALVAMGSFLAKCDLGITGVANESAQRTYDVTVTTMTRKPMPDKIRAAVEAHCKANGGRLRVVSVTVAKETK